MKVYFGTVYRKDVNELTDLLRETIKQGYYGVDTAKVYQNEKVVGAAVAALKEEGIDVKIQTKIWTADFKNARKAFEDQIKELGVSKVHSLLLHRPSINFWDSVEAWKELIKLQKEGLVKHIGVSNFEADMIRILVKETGVKPEINQIEASLTCLTQDRIFFNNKQGIELQGWSVLGKDAMETLNNPIVKKIANKYNAKPIHVVNGFLKWFKISPVVGTSKVERLKDNNTFIDLKEEDINELLKLNKYENKYEVSYPYDYLEDTSWK